MTKPTGRRGPRAQYFYDNVYTIVPRCKVWPFAATPNGYGVIQVGGRQYSVHNLACLAWNGPPPAGMTAAHGPCHDRLCFNGAHLSWRTPRQQWEDQVRDGTAMLGARNHASKLTPGQVREIRALYALGGVTQWGLARRYGIRQAAISALLRGVTWQHVG